MNRKKFLNNVKDLVFENDIVFCIGQSLCNEAPELSKGTVFINDTHTDILSVALGVAMTTDKRVLLILEDQYLLSNFNAVFQIAVSKCTNLYLIVATSTLYTHEVAQTNLFNSIRSMVGVLVNTGMLVHEYSKYFETKKSLKLLKDIYSRTIGPVISFVVITNNRLYTTCGDTRNLEELNTLSEFIKDKSLETSLTEVNTPFFNLESIMKDK